jgi:DNA-binding protein HU-beta
MVFINQIREKIGVMFGNPETTTGGRALKFYASVRLDIRRIAAIKDGDNVIGNRTAPKWSRTRSRRRSAKPSSTSLYGEGISREGDLLDLGVGPEPGGEERLLVQLSRRAHRPGPRQRIRRRDMAAATKLTQSQVIRELAESNNVSTRVAKEFVTKFADLAVRETKKNGVFIIPGIGRLVRVDRKARIGRNPATGEAIKIPAKKVVKFRVAKAVKDAIVPPKKK